MSSRLLVGRDSEVLGAETIENWERSPTSGGGGGGEPSRFEGRRRQRVSIPEA